MALFFDSLTATGSNNDDFILGTPAGGANNSLSGGLGDDLIIGDLGGLFTTAGASAATATDLTTDTSQWTTNENPDIVNSTSVPHTTVHGTGNGSEHWYSFTVLGNETATIDIDYGDHDIGGSADFVIEIYDSTGNTLLASNDNADATDGGNGSTSDSDPFLEFNTGGASRFFIRIKTATGDTVPIGAEYILNVSITGQTATGTSTNGADSLFGGDGDDVLYGQGGADVIEGGNDDDTIEGGSGGDNLNGGADIDTVSYASSNAAVTVRLDLMTASGGHAQGDLISNFENVIGSEFGDVLFGLQGANNTLLGGGGNDNLVGRGGTDLVSGGAGNDQITVDLVAGESGSTLDGGDGNDTLIIVGFSDSSEDFTDDTLISLETLAIQGIPFDYSLTFRADQITQFSSISGFAGPGADRNITVEMGSETELDLSGVTVTGFAGPNDGFLIIGDGDAETVTGTSVNDTIDGSDGADSIDGGDGHDVVSYASQATIGGGALGVFVDLGNSFGVGNGAQGDTFANIEEVIGTDDRDFLFGTSGSDTLRGGDQFDQLSGADGGATDTLDGGAGFDIAVYSTATTDLVVDLADHTSGANVGEHTADVWIDIEGIFGVQGFTNTFIGSDAALEYLIGGGLGDTIDGNGGRDFLFGLGGDDMIDGGTDADLLFAGGGTDTVTGGAGRDVFYVEQNNDIDIITDWVEADDFFLFFGVTGVSSFGDLAFNTSGADVIITEATGANTSFEVTVQNVGLSDLDNSGNFLFG